MSKVRCQRIGCDAFFSDDDNPEGSCQYHAAGPFFHDGMKEWSCCKKRSHDFSLFMEIPGCKTGKHTTEKPILPTSTRKAVTPKAPSPVVTTASTTNLTAKESCLRCRQGFFCSDHAATAPGNEEDITGIENAVSGSQSKQMNVNAVKLAESAPVEIKKDEPRPSPSAPPKKIIDINHPQTCKNKGCGQTFKERDNHETACSYHPGPAVFHDRVRGWKCCDIHVKEFDEFMSIPPCTKGWHNAESTP